MVAGDAASGAWLILHNDLLAETFGETWRQNPGHHIRGHARRKADDDSDQLSGKILSSRGDGAACHVEQNCRGENDPTEAHGIPLLLPTGLRKHHKTLQESAELFGNFRVRDGAILIKHALRARDQEPSL